MLRIQLQNVLFRSLETFDYYRLNERSLSVLDGVMLAVRFSSYCLRKEALKMSTYTPHPLDTAHVVVPKSLLGLMEKLAENAHEVWAAQRIKEGWTYGTKRDDSSKTHPCLVPYDQLPDSEKEYDRKTAGETIKAVLALGYRIEE